jgi:hypothetical protein
MLEKADFEKIRGAGCFLSEMPVEGSGARQARATGSCFPLF